MTVTVPIRSNLVHYDVVPLSISSDTAQYGTVPEVAFTTLNRTDNIQYGTSFNQDVVSVTLPIRLHSAQFDTCNYVPL